MLDKSEGVTRDLCPIVPGKTIDEKSDVQAEVLYLGYIKVAIIGERDETSRQKLKVDDTEPNSSESLTKLHDRNPKTNTLDETFMEKSLCNYCCDEYGNQFAEIIECPCSVPFCGNCAKIEQVEGKTIIKCPNIPCDSLCDNENINKFSVNTEYEYNDYVKDKLNVPCPLSHGGDVGIYDPSDEAVEIKPHKIQACSKDEHLTFRVLRNIPDHIKCDHLPKEAKELLKNIKGSALTNIFEANEFKKIKQHNKVVNMVKSTVDKPQPGVSQYSSSSVTSASVISEPVAKYKTSSGGIKQPVIQRPIGESEFDEAFNTFKPAAVVSIDKIFETVDKKGLNDHLIEISTLAALMVKKFGTEAINISTTRELKYAVVLEYVGEDYTRLKNISSKLGDFSPRKKYELVTAIQNRIGYPPYFNTVINVIAPTDYIHLFKLLKDSFRLPEPSPVRGSSIYDCFFCQNKLTGHLVWWMRELINNECSKLADVLMPELDRIICARDFKRVNSDGEVETGINIADHFLKCASNLLIIVAACSDISDLADTEALGSYITSLLSDNDGTYMYFPHIARELAFLSKQPKSVGYSRYIDAVARILGDKSFTVEEYAKHEQLTDLRGFTLLEGNHTLEPYLTDLIQHVQKLPRKHSEVLLDEIAEIKAELKKTGNKNEPGTTLRVDIKDLPLVPKGCTEVEQKIKIKEKVHRLLLVIALYPKSQLSTVDPALAPFAKGILKHGYKKDIFYLLSGMFSLFRSSSEIQKLLAPTEISTGGNNCLLAPLGLVRLHNAGVISREDLKIICKNLKTATVRTKKQMKKGSTFHYWLLILEKIKTCPPSYIGKALQQYTLNNENRTIHESLALIEIASLAKKIEKKPVQRTEQCKTTMINKSGEEQFLEPDDYQLQHLFPVIFEKGTPGFFEKNRAGIEWLLKQRHPLLFFTYLMKVKSNESDVLSEKDQTELITLIQQFAETSASGRFVESRQSPANNPHLEAVYNKWPSFKKGWGVNFKGFSSEITCRLDSGKTEALELTENSWDLFISGFDLNTCHTPSSCLWQSRSLMSYVMDGRNAMIVKKNTKGKILGRALVLIALVENNNPVLFMESPYPLMGDNAAENTRLFIDAALEIADQMKLTLYTQKKKDFEGQVTKLTMLEGRAPYDHFDSISCAKPMPRMKIDLPAVKVERTVFSTPKSGLTHMLGAVSTNSGKTLKSRKRPLNDSSDASRAPQKMAKIEPSTITANSATC